MTIVCTCAVSQPRVALQTGCRAAARSTATGRVQVCAPRYRVRSSGVGQRSGVSRGHDRAFVGSVAQQNSQNTTSTSHPKSKPVVDSSARAAFFSVPWSKTHVAATVYRCISARHRVTRLSTNCAKKKKLYIYKKNIKHTCCTTVPVYTARRRVLSHRSSSSHHSHRCCNTLSAAGRKTRTRPLLQYLVRRARCSTGGTLYARVTCHDRLPPSSRSLVTAASPPLTPERECFSTISSTGTSPSSHVQSTVHYTTTMTAATSTDHRSPSFKV